MIDLSAREKGLQTEPFRFLYGSVARQTPLSISAKRSVTSASVSAETGNQKNNDQPGAGTVIVAKQADAVRPVVTSAPAAIVKEG